MSSISSYQETIDYLYGLQKHGVKLALANSVALMEIMGNPHARFRAIHVAGTNGKGSTSAFIAGVLQAAGYRVGLYTSPHLISFTERIRINGAPIDGARVVELAQRVRERYRRLADDGSATLNPTFFEVTTAMAFTYFAEEGIDIAVVEVGMGGRLDSTNVITPLVSVITTIDLEHMEYLGTTLEQIAGEKAGIIKPGVPVVTGAVQPEAVAVIERTADEQGARVFRLDHDFAAENRSAEQGQLFDYRGIKSAFQQLRISMIGRHQIDNACLALAAVECLGEAGITVDEPALRRGLEQTRWDGRLERVAERPAIYLDGAHNPASAKMLARAITSMKPSYRRLVLVIGVLGDKDYRGIIAELVPLADEVIVTRPAYSRAMDLETLAAEVRMLHRCVETADTVRHAIAKATEKAAQEDLVLITGSLYVVGDARAEFAGPSDTAFTGLKG